MLKTPELKEIRSAISESLNFYKVEKEKTTKTILFFFDEISRLINQFNENNWIANEVKAARKGITAVYVTDRTEHLKELKKNIDVYNSLLDEFEDWQLEFIKMLYCKSYLSKGTSATDKINKNKLYVVKYPILKYDQNNSFIKEYYINGFPETKSKIVSFTEPEIQTIINEFVKKYTRKENRTGNPIEKRPTYQTWQIFADLYVTNELLYKGKEIKRKLTARDLVKIANFIVSKDQDGFDKKITYKQYTNRKARGTETKINGFIQEARNQNKTTYKEYISDFIHNPDQFLEYEL